MQPTPPDTLDSLDSETLVFWQDKQRSASSLQEIMEKLKQAKQQALKTEGETDPPTVPVKDTKLTRASARCGG